MSRATSALFKTMANAQETKDVLLALITVNSPYITGGPLRFVQDLQDLVSNGNTYTAFPFQITLPEDTDEGPAKITLVIDNIDRSITIAIRSIPPTSPPTVDVQLVIAGQPNTVEISITGMTLRNLTGDQFQIEGELHMDEEDLIPFPEGLIAPQYFPGVFR